jgi:flagellar L-ring protein precursor FlgH
MSRKTFALFSRAVLAPFLLCSPVFAQSLWPQERGAERRATPVADLVARARGDIVTVLIRESQETSQKEQTKLAQSTSLKAALKDIGVFPHTFAGNPLPSAEAESSRNFQADGQIDKNGRLDARLSAVVIEVQPNGNLVIEGKRTVRIDDEVKTLTISGVVRPADLTPANTVLSENVAEASVSLSGDGALSRNSSRGLLGTIFDWLWHNLWPF